MNEYSEFALKLSQGAGISRLMADLGSALESAKSTGQEISMMGGGNPAHIPAVEEEFRKIYLQLAEDPNHLAGLLGDYTSPQGSRSFRQALAVSLSQKLNYPFTEDHFAITQGSQSAFFLLFNSLAGRMKGGNSKKILLPIVPEYIGYADQGIEKDMFTSIPPRVETTSPNRFRYYPDIALIEERLQAGDIGAICFSRPTNPSGNVIPWEDVEKIYSLGRSENIPVIIDNAYGFPFPNILFQEPEIQWKPGMIHVLSLSKLGLPGVRTGIVIADPEITSLIGDMSAILHLAGGNLGPAMGELLLQGDRIFHLSKEYIQPFYRSRSQEVQNIMDESFRNLFDYKIHESLGALFLWLWLPNHPKSAQEIYQLGKKQGLFVIPGDWFFPGCEEDGTGNFSHKRNCIRLTYSRNISEVKRGIKILSKILS